MYQVHAMGVHYASFNQEEDAQEWAKYQSSKFQNGWWEVRKDYPAGSILSIAFQHGEIVFGRDALIINL